MHSPAVLGRGLEALFSAASEDIENRLTCESEWYGLRGVEEVLWGILEERF